MNNRFILFTFGVVAILGVAMNLPAHKSSSSSVSVGLSNSQASTTPQAAVTSSNALAQPESNLPPSSPSKIDLGLCGAIIATSTIYSENPNNAIIQQLFVQTSTAAWSAAMISNGTGSGYCFSYPTKWTINMVGAAGTNVAFNQGAAATGTTEQTLYIELAQNSSLENADKAVATYEESASPLVDPSEKVLKKQIETIGDKQVLLLLTDMNGINFYRYFIVHSGLTLMFQASAPAEETTKQEYVDFWSNAGAVVSSTRFNP